jgi:hypothetical protein
VVLLVGMPNEHRVKPDGPVAHIFEDQPLRDDGEGEGVSDGHLMLAFLSATSHRTR